MPFMLIKFSILSVACKRIIMFSKFHITLRITFIGNRSQGAPCLSPAREFCRLLVCYLMLYNFYVPEHNIAPFLLSSDSLSDDDSWVTWQRPLNVWLLKCFPVNKNIYYLLLVAFLLSLVSMFYDVDTMRTSNINFHAVFHALTYDMTKCGGGKKGKRITNFIIV